MNDKVHISSLLVTANPEITPSVVASINEMAIAEVAFSNEVGKIIVTLETEDEAEIVQALTDIQLKDGVANASLVYHHAEAIADEDVASQNAKETRNA